MRHDLPLDEQHKVSSGGDRLRWPLACPRQAWDDLVRLDWCLARPALDRSGRLMRLLDLPAWQRRGAGSVAETAAAESPPLPAPDAVAACTADFEQLAIEVDGGAYRPTAGNLAPRWEFSPALGRLCGSVVLAPRIAEPALPDFTEYLLRLNGDLRFARVGYLGRGIALQVVFAAEDRRWLDLGQDALSVIYELLRPQVAWWNQPRELVVDLFREAAGL
ncbi:MAG: hypothetical protein ABSG86_26245 [Thermoguttaceae bacterium]|jgi:hypothetical protein